MMKTLIAASAVALLLMGCGGGSDDDQVASTPLANNPATPATPATPVAPAAPAASADVAAASLATANRAGLVALASNQAKVAVYDVAADTGDSLRITFDRFAGTYAIQVLNTRNGQVASSGTFTTTAAGDRTTYTANGLALTVDQRTRLLSGTITQGARTASVIGTGYVAGNIASLAGDYLFAGSVRNVSDGRDRDTLDGVIRVDAGGNVQVCDEGVFNAAGACVDRSGSGTPELSQFVLAAQDGIVVLRQNGANVGVVHVLASERGVGLLVDGAGFNRADRTLRAGTLAAVAPFALTTDVYGNYACTAQGTLRAEITLAGTSAQLRRLFNNTSRTELAWYNRAIDDDRLFNQDGLLSLSATASLDDDSVVLPVSGSLLVMVDLSLIHI